MGEMRIPRRGLIVGAVAVAAGTWALTRNADVVHSSRPRRRTLASFRDMPVEGARIVTDPAAMPNRFFEAPQLAALTQSGMLPPVAERIGLDPLIVQPLNEIGAYGGTIRRGFIGTNDFQGVVRFAGGPDSLLSWDPEWQNVRPNIAREFAYSEGNRVLTIGLRRGMRWSDGHAFTVDDVMFWFEMMYGEPRIVGQPSGTLMIDGKPVIIKRIDDHHFQFVAPAPYPALVEFLAGYSDIAGQSLTGQNAMGLFAPRHYLKQFHPAFKSEESLAREARDAGFASWSLRFRNLNNWLLNPDLPVVSPWRMTVPINRLEHVLERNPYSIWVDTAGNQLPYADRVSHELCASPDAVNFKAATGAFDFQNRHLQVSKLPFLLSNRDRSDYEVRLDPYEGCDLAIRFNFNYQVDPLVGRLILDHKFRKALSLACDREAINESLMLGAGVPSASVPARENRFYPGDKWARMYAQRDLVQANQLLDQVGLEKRDQAGYRLRPDGRGRLRIPCQAIVSHFDYTTAGEMLREQWRAIGIDIDVQVVEVTLFIQRAAAGEVAMTLQMVSNEDPISFPDHLFPFTRSGVGPLIGPEFVTWFQSGGAKGKRPPEFLVEMMELWRSALKLPSKDRIEAGRNLLRLHVEQLVSIGLISAGLSFYAIRVVNNDLGNVPRRVVNTNLVKNPSSAMPMTFYYRKANQEGPA
jgi:peptide/nickel transport system substrate-binding protein